MFGQRRGYDAIGEPAVSNADKPRVQPVKVDPKANPGVPSWRDAVTPSTRLVSRNDGSGWSLFRF